MATTNLCYVEVSLYCRDNPVVIRYMIKYVRFEQVVQYLDKNSTEQWFVPLFFCKQHLFLFLFFCKEIKYFCFLFFWTNTITFISQNKNITDPVILPLTKSVWKYQNRICMHCNCTWNKQTQPIYHGFVGLFTTCN